jgi:8-oxo-dGTP pyrophosphatase MutT (NUDIX family)
VSRSPITIDIGTVEVYVIHPHADGWRVLVLQRSALTRCPGSWEAVAGSIEEGERPEAAALREVREETGLPVDRLYCVGVQPFYLPRQSSVQLSMVFAAFVSGAEGVTLGPEHERHEWLGVARARDRVTWPRARHTIADIERLLGPDNIAAVEDVLRVK